MLLFRTLFSIVLSFLTLLFLAQRGIAIHPTLGVPLTLIVFYLLSFIPTLIAGNASRGKALRAVQGPLIGGRQPDPPRDHKSNPTIPLHQCWYLESTPQDGDPMYSCSFVEFDERGDYLDFNQHVHAYQKVEDLAKGDLPLLIVGFVHGWRNSAQSGNVISFCDFLNQVAKVTNDGAHKYRVHGIYIGWRGACLKHVIDRKERAYTEVLQQFGGKEIVAEQEMARFPSFTENLETLSYFDRKGVPEHLISGTSLSRTLFTCAHVAKRVNPKSKVTLIGHSFGGLTLERTFQNACIAELVDGWPWDEPIPPGKIANPLPFDIVLLINSAAPSIYARQFQSFMAAHRAAMRAKGIPGSDGPIFFSLTSDGDNATGTIHPIANCLSFMLPSLRRKYLGKDFILAKPEGNGVEIPQSFYYSKTPGHNPLLVNRFVERTENPMPPLVPKEGIFYYNLHCAGNSGTFLTESQGQNPVEWGVNFPPTSKPFDDFSKYETHRPVVWEQDSITKAYLNKDTGYWIIRCSKDIIRDHNDIWNCAAMQTYAALYSIGFALKQQIPQSPQPPAPSSPPANPASNS